MASGVTPLPDWLAQRPSAFDIVTAYYPESKPKGEIKLRPCLVLDVLKHKETGEFACRIAYGTKNLRSVQRQTKDLIIQNSADLAVIGLPLATRFDLDDINIVALPWTPDFFGCWGGYSHPKIGALIEKYVKDYAYLMMLRRSVGPET